MTLVCGIDPGKTGGICFVRDSYIARLDVMPDMHALASILAEMNPRHVYIEKSQPMPKQGVSSVFTYGDHFGQIQGIVIALGLTFTLVPPQTWQKAMFTGTPAGFPPKKRAVLAAKRLCPSLDFLATERSRKPHEGLVDAALIALFGYRHQPFKETSREREESNLGDLASDCGTRNAEFKQLRDDPAGQST